jgi:hypothetical protein
MEGIRPATSFLRMLSDRLGDAQFTLIDIGCSGGIDEIWRVFGSRLRAFGFDPNLQEVERLNAAAKSQPGLEYIAAFVGPPQDDPAMARMRARDFWAHNPWGRLSVARTLEIRAAEIAKSGSVEKQRLNQWMKVPLADADQPLVLADFLRDRAVHDVDFVKIDVDGADLVILRSLEQVLKDTQVLGLGIEVNFFGSDDADLNTFHNVDRFMKGAGFELFDLSMRRYSARALPAPYTYVNPAQGAWGRILQGDALYVRDVAAPEHAGFARTLAPHKLAKLSAIFAVFGLPDCAAEVLVQFRSELASILDIDRALDALVEHCVSKGITAPSYDTYIKEFERDGARFYPARRFLSWR